MKKRISAKLFFTVVWRGIRQVLCAIGRVFDYKNKTPFWRVICAIWTVCVALIVGIVSYFWVIGLNQKYNNSYSYNAKYLSCNIVYHPATYSRLGYIMDERTQKKLLTDINWVIISSNDSLAVFCKNQKRGYLNIYTGKEVIPAIYRKAWVFSDGVASVLQNDSIYFIDHSGNRIVERGFDPLHEDYEESYVFNRGYCKVKSHGKWGAIDTTGKIVVPIEYDYVSLEDNNFWMVGIEDRWGVFNNSAEMLFPCEYTKVIISKENGIYLSDDRNYCKRYSFTGELQDDFVVDEVEKLSFGYNEETGVSLLAKSLSYKVPGGWYGLMSKDGCPITDPIFSSIEAVDEDLYLCHYEDDYIYDGEGILMNSRGEIVKLHN